MSLVKSPVLTPAKLAANRANARRSTGPRTVAGKRRIVLNALKHGRYSRAFRESLIKAGADVALFDWIRARIVDCFEPRNAAESWQAERIAREVWCQTWRDQRADRRARDERAQQSQGAEAPRPACRVDQRDGSRLRRRVAKAGDRVSLWSLAWTPWRRGGLERNPRYAVQSADSAVTSLSQIRIENPRTGRRLAFWVRRRRAAALPRIPLWAYPEILAWLLQHEEEFVADL